MNSRATEGIEAKEEVDMNEEQRTAESRKALGRGFNPRYSLTHDERFTARTGSERVVGTKQGRGSVGSFRPAGRTRHHGHSDGGDMIAG